MPEGVERGAEWRTGTLTKFERMTDPSWQQDVRLVEFQTDQGLM